MKPAAAHINHTTPTTTIYARCPGCFSWHQSKHLVLIPIDALDDGKPFAVCVHCAITLRDDDYADIKAVVDNIGAYAGWTAHNRQATRNGRNLVRRCVE